MRRSAPDNEGFFWLQAIGEPDLAFLVTDPQPFFKDYEVPIREETQADLQLADTKDGRVLVICNRVGEWLTGNLLGPLVINTASHTGLQLVVTEKKWTCRQPLMRLGATGVGTWRRQPERADPCDAESVRRA